MRTGVLVALLLAALVLVGLVVVYLDVMHMVRDWADLHDGPVALGLGFGTTDLPQARAAYTSRDLLPPGTALGTDEYLVTAK